MKLTRKELYDLVWSEPMTAICKRFGVTDSGLRKHCASMNIPTPPMGYWSKLQNGKRIDKTPLPDNYHGKQQNADANDVIIDLTPPVNRQKVREMEISAENASVFNVPEVLYAKDPLIIDTKEKFRKNSNENNYLKRNPYKNQIKETLDIFVSNETIDRALSIFSTVIKCLQFRGHSIKIEKNTTYAVINGEEIQINITERKKLDTSSDYRDTVFCGELHFNILYGFRDKTTYKDTPHTKLEDKMISIIAFLEIKSDDIKTERIEEEKREAEREEKERNRREFEAKCSAELKQFQSLFSMAERLHKANILREYIHTYEAYLAEKGIADEEVLKKLEWAKDKADWIDPFISKEDVYLDRYEKDEVIQSKCSKSHSYERSYYGSSNERSFWQKPWWRK